MKDEDKKNLENNKDVNYVYKPLNISFLEIIDT